MTVVRNDTHTLCKLTVDLGLHPAEGYV